MQIPRATSVYLDRAVRHLRGSGTEVPDERLAHVAPPGWEHIGLTGDLLWAEIDKPRARFRPLRLHQTSRDAERTFPTISHRTPECVGSKIRYAFVSPH